MVTKVNPSLETCNQSLKAKTNQMTSRKRCKANQRFTENVLAESLAGFLLPRVFLSDLFKSWNMCSDWPQSLYKKILPNLRLLPNMMCEERWGQEAWTHQGRILIIIEWLFHNSGDRWANPATWVEQVMLFNPIPLMKTRRWEGHERTQPTQLIEGEALHSTLLPSETARSLTVK